MRRIAVPLRLLLVPAILLPVILWSALRQRLFGLPDGGSLRKRHALENRLNEQLGWTGLGHMDGGSIGSGTMESFVYVVDPEIGKRVIADDLRDTRFGDYVRIVVHEPYSQWEENR